MDRLLNGDEVAERLGVVRKTLDRMVADGLFPAPIRLGPRLLRWETSTVSAWIEAQREAVKP